GTVTISGAGSTLTAGDFITVGYGGTGTLTISDGGAASAVDDVNIGKDAGAEGTVTISGAGSTLTAGDFITVGYGGTGTLTISDGGA
ncbi:autotransporter outer membrane beta-barrel domain-containing protein, partial [Rhodobacterales bacterium]